MLATGFLGTRADAFVDVAVVFFVAAPFLMALALRLAAQHRYRAHRGLQTGVLLGAIVAVLLLEGSIRFGGAMDAFALSAYHGTATLAGLFGVHLAVAIPTFIAWCVLAVLSWRRFPGVLPGSFGPRHQLWGRLTFAGLWFTCATGVGLYVMSFAL
ncbi:MAG: DUF420 domain-containing protein [Acidobacteriota bacterium]|nr:DUF420 domain-containing protein [Acidobacteriota bacterium]